MENKSYYFQPDKNFKQGYIVFDENKNVVYEAKMTKFGLFTAFKFQFINHIANTSVEHKVGHTLTQEQNSLFDVVDFFSTKSSFKFDGKKIWDYLHENGIRIDSHVSGKKLGMSYKISKEGNEIATVATASGSGNKFFITNKACYSIDTTEENLDWAFLAAFAFARTEQVFYD